MVCPVLANTPYAGCYDLQDTGSVIILEWELLLLVLFQPQPQLIAVCSLKHILHKPAVHLHVDLHRASIAEQQQQPMQAVSHTYSDTERIP